MIDLRRKPLLSLMIMLAFLMIVGPVRVSATASGTAIPQVNILKTKSTIKKGKTQKLAISLANISSSDIVWSSSNKKVVKINAKTGKIRGKSGGTAIITARVKGTNIQDSILVKCKDYYKLRVKTTGYCGGSCCNGAWAGARTASGRRARANHTIAVDRRVIPLGSKVKIGNRIYVAEDTGVHGRTIDIYYSSARRAHGHGVQYKTVKVYY